MNKTNLTQHPCANKCSNFKEEQCNHCLVQINCYQDEDQSMGTRTIIESDFAKGDTVVFIDAFMPDHLMEVHQMQGDRIFSHLLRHATTAELNAKRRLSLTEQSWGEVS